MGFKGWGGENSSGTGKCRTVLVGCWSYDWHQPLGLNKGSVMSNDKSSQTVIKHDDGIPTPGLICFDVIGRALDRDLLCLLAQHLSKPGTEATRLRLLLSQAISGARSEKRTILSALRNSPLVGADVDFNVTRV
jgi:hypothetical protein